MMRSLHDSQLERALLARIMDEGERALLAVEETGLKALDFYFDNHQRLFSVIQKRIERGEPVDRISLVGALSEDDEAKAYGGPNYISFLEDLPVTAGYAGDTIRSWAILRRTDEMGRWMKDCVHRRIPGGRIKEYAESVASKVESMAGRLRDAASAPKFLPVRVAVEEWFAMKERVDRGEVGPALSTGIIALDNWTNGGLYGGDLVILGGRAAMGKTSGGYTVANNVLNAGYGVGAVTLEMPRIQVSGKLAALRSRVPYGCFRSFNFEDARDDSGQLIKDAERRGMRAMREIAELPFMINEASRQWPDIRSQARRLHRTMARNGTQMKLLMIDYLGLIEDEEYSDSVSQRTERVVYGCKHLAKELDIPVLLLVQINRAAEKANTYIPELRNLRNSGAIEQAADLAILIYREGYYFKDRAQDTVTWIVAKNRHNRTGDISLQWEGSIGRVSDFPLRSTVASTKSSTGGVW